MEVEDPLNGLHTASPRPGSTWLLPHCCRFHAPGPTAPPSRAASSHLAGRPAVEGRPLSLHRMCEAKCPGHPFPKGIRAVGARKALLSTNRTVLQQCLSHPPASATLPPPPSQPAGGIVCRTLSLGLGGSSLLCSLQLRSSPPKHGQLDAPFCWSIVGGGVVPCPLPPLSQREAGWKQSQQVHHHFGPLRDLGGNVWMGGGGPQVLQQLGSVSPTKPSGKQQPGSRTRPSGPRQRQRNCRGPKKESHVQDPTPWEGTALGILSSPFFWFFALRPQLHWSPAGGARGLSREESRPPPPGSTKLGSVARQQIPHLLCSRSGCGGQGRDSPRCSIRPPPPKVPVLTPG